MDNEPKRKKGKSNDDSYEQVTAYIKRDTHKAVKIELVKQGKQDFSDLLQELLEKWLKSRT